MINLWDLSQEARKEYKIPQKLWVQVEKILTKLSLAATSEPPAKRARVDLPPPRVGKGDLLEGTLEPQRIPLAMLVESVVIDGQHGTAEISLRIGYGPGDRTKCSPGEGLVLWG